MLVNRIPLGYNAVPAKARKLVLEVFESGQFSPGPKAREFEEKFAKLHNAKHAIFVNSGTDALRLSLLALKEKYTWEDGDYVAVPALTFVATVNVILQAGLQPFFVDVSECDYGINAWDFGQRYDAAFKLPLKAPFMRAVMPVHLFGQSCTSEIFDVAKKMGLHVLEDSCETILNPLRGDISCHSTYMAHHVTTGVGGFALTNDEDLMLLIRSYANHGRNVGYLPGCTRPTRPSLELLQNRFRFDRIGYSSRPTELEAALGLSQLDSLKANVERRRQVTTDLQHALYPFWADLQLLVTDETSSNMMFPIVIKKDSHIEKYDLCLHLEKHGIETRDMMPITNQPCYKGLVKEEDFPVAQWINKNGFYISCNPNLTSKDVRYIAKTFQAHLQKK